MCPPHTHTLYTVRPHTHTQRSFNEMQTWITELRQLGPQNLVLAIAGNKLDLESSRQVSQCCESGRVCDICVCRCPQQLERRLLRMQMLFLWRRVLKMVITYKNCSRKLVNWTLIVYSAYLTPHTPTHSSHTHTHTHTHTHSPPTTHTHCPPHTHTV